MKSTIFSELKKQTYPCLKINHNDKMIVLFVKNNTGTVVHKGPSNSMELGEYHNNWNEDLFTMYDERVVLEND